MAGGINKTWWIGDNEEPVLLIHGDQDRTIPYYFDQVYRLPLTTSSHLLRFMVRVQWTQLLTIEVSTTS